MTTRPEPPGADPSPVQRLAWALASRAAALVDEGAALDPYLERYLPEHAAAAGDWGLLGDVELVDRLDPRAVAAEAFRAAPGQAGGLPAAVTVTMVAARNWPALPTTRES